jgi:hypothetical protein
LEERRFQNNFLWQESTLHLRVGEQLGDASTRRTNISDGYLINNRNAGLYRQFDSVYIEFCLFNTLENHKGDVQGLLHNQGSKCLYLNYCNFIDCKNQKNGNVSLFDADKDSSYIPLMIYIRFFF